MGAITNQQIAALAARAGHRDLEVVPTRRGYRVICSCGYSSSTRGSVLAAASAGGHHLRKVVTALRASGVSLRVDVPQGTPEGKGANAPAAA